MSEQAKAPEAQKPGPAQDIREVQNLLVLGIFPGQMAPAVVKAYQTLEKMAQAKEAEVAKAVEAEVVA